MIFEIHYNNRKSALIMSAETGRELEKYLTMIDGGVLSFKDELEAGAVIFKNDVGQELGFYRPAE